MEVEKYVGYWLFYAHRCCAYTFAEGLRQYCIEQGKPYIVTPAQWGVLTLLYEHDGLTVGTISQRRALDAPTITGVITRLEHNGLVTRLRDDKDRRIVKAYLTDEGRQITRLLFGVVEEMNSEMMQGFSGEEWQDLQEKLRRIAGNVTATMPDSDIRWQLLSESLPENRVDKKQRSRQERSQKEG